MKRVTARKRFRAKLAALKAWLKSVRSTIKSRDVWWAFCVKLRGHYAYYGVTDNSPALARFLYEARRLLRKWFNCRGGKVRSDGKAIPEHVVDRRTVACLCDPICER